MNRAVIIGTTLVGLLCLGLSASSSWFDVPVSLVIESSTELGEVLRVDAAAPAVTRFFQAAATIVVILILFRIGNRLRWGNRLSALGITQSVGRPQSSVAVTIASVWLVVAASYPFFVMIREPEIAAHATWLQMQHDNLIWLGGDINTSQELSRTGWKSKVYVVDAPRQLSVMKLPSWSPTEIGMNRFSELVEWLGYSNAFCQFVRRGWKLAMIGGVALLLVTYFENWELQLGRVGYSVGLIAMLSAAFAVAAWSVPFAASRQIARAAGNTTSGNFSAAVQDLDRVAAILPVIAHDTYYVAQRGLLDCRLGDDSAYAKLFTAVQSESEGRFHQALIDYRALADNERNPVAVRREANRAILRSGIQSLNSGGYKEANRILAQVLRRDPCNLKAIYVQQLAQLRLGDRMALERSAKHLYAVCEHLGFPTKKVLLASTQQHLAYAAMLEGDTMAAWQGTIRMRRP